MQKLIVGAITGRPAHPVALKFQAAYGEFIDGYTSYFDRRGPGQGRLRCAGWLQAHREERSELEESERDMAKEKPILFSGEMVKAILDGRKTMTRRVVKNDAHCPYASGDTLWVRETFMIERFPSAPDKPLVHYRADNTAAGSAWTAARMWKPSIFMPRWASRITLRITDVRSERLQEITAVDMRAEGIDCLYENDGSISEHFTRQSWFNLWDSINAKRGFGWDANPWVWVVSFEKL